MIKYKTKVTNEFQKFQKRQMIGTNIQKIQKNPTLKLLTKTIFNT
jgi:hypothetical protein